MDFYTNKTNEESKFGIVSCSDETLVKLNNYCEDFYDYYNGNDEDLQLHLISNGVFNENKVDPKSLNELIVSLNIWLDSNKEGHYEKWVEKYAKEMKAYSQKQNNYQTER